MRSVSIGHLAVGHSDGWVVEIEHPEIYEVTLFDHLAMFLEARKKASPTNMKTSTIQSFVWYPLPLRPRRPRLWLASGLCLMGLVSALQIGQAQKQTQADRAKAAPAQNTPPTRAESLPPASVQTTPIRPPAPLVNREYRKGILYGKVLDIAGKPVAGATVALQDKKGRVLGWTQTNADGEYALAADPKDALHLRPSRRRGLLEQCARAVGDVVAAPLKAVSDAVTHPGETLKSAAVSIATGTPAPLAAQAAARAVAPGVQDKNFADETARKARETAAKTAVGEGPAPPKKDDKDKPEEKGETRLLVSAPGFKAMQGNSQAYWLEASDQDKDAANQAENKADAKQGGKNKKDDKEKAKQEKDSQRGMQAWLETIKLAPLASDKKSQVAQEVLTLTEAVVEPGVVAAGETVTISAKLHVPPELVSRVRVFAREARRASVIELYPQEDKDNTLFVGVMTLDPRLPPGDTTITIAALRAEPVEVHLDPKKIDPLFLFVRRLEDMQPGKPYEYDPRIMASENRADVKMLVLDGRQASPTTITPPHP